MRAVAIKIIKSFNFYLALCALILVTACSGAGSTGSTKTAEGGISGTGISFGSIAAFSSVIVNGTKLETNNQTEIFVDEQSATVAELKIGYVIRVDADFDENTAKRIDYVETVRGPLVAVPLFNPDTFAGSFDLLGQTVLTNSITIFDSISDLSTLNIGDVLEVSGVRDSSGAIIARYVNLKTLPVTEYRVVGVVANSTPTTFDIGSLTVDYSSADISEFGSNGIVNGAEVRVKGPAANFNSAMSTFLAGKITLSSLRVALVEGIDLELEGAITEFQSISDFNVNGIPVDASSAIVENGIPAELQLDVLVEVEGRVDVSNILIASRVKIIPLGNIRVESTVDSVDLVNLSIVVQGQLFSLDEKTQLEDNSIAQITEFSLNDLSPSDWVEIRGYELNNVYTLTRLERDDPDTDVRVQAPVDENGIDQANKTISILGITISTNAGTEYEGINDQPMSENLFFSTVQENDLVKAKWQNFTSNTVPVDELSLED